MASNNRVEAELLNALDILTGFVGNPEYAFHIPSAVESIEKARAALRSLELAEPILKRFVERGEYEHVGPSSLVIDGSVEISETERDYLVGLGYEPFP